MKVNCAHMFLGALTMDQLKAKTFIKYAFTSILFTPRNTTNALFFRPPTTPRFVFSGRSKYFPVSMARNAIKSKPARATASNVERLEDNTSLEPQYFLIKSEPSEFSIHNLEARPRQREEWDGVRNYAARNHIRSMRENDRCWFYHSACKTPAIVGTCRVVRTAAPDATALDSNHPGYDPKSTAESCRWDSVLVELESIFESPITLKELRAQAKINKTVASMTILKMSRLSVTPVTRSQWDEVARLLERKEQGEDLLM
jgi:predicted RNA-binding protein with PUA-like domain